jgi:hypothetical protein
MFIPILFLYHSYTFRLNAVSVLLDRCAGLDGLDCLVDFWLLLEHKILSDQLRSSIFFAVTLKIIYIAHYTFKYHHSIYNIMLQFNFNKKKSGGL